MKVGITGVTGYLGSFVAKAFLNKGSYFVRGSVRSLTNPSKIDPIKQAFSGYEDKYELVEADLTNSESLVEFVKGCDTVIHVASPFPHPSAKVKEDDVIKPAVDGTMTILKAAHEFGIKRVVCTSSVATIADPFGMKLLYDHEDYVDPDLVPSIYSRSKIIAEQKSWEYIEELKSSSDNPLELVTIHPGAIVGPTFNKNTEFTSMKFIKGLAEGNIPLLPRVTFSYSDVRDLGEMHVNALTAPANKRYVVCTGSYFFSEVAQMIKDEFPNRGLKTKTTEMPFIVVRVMKHFNPFVKNSMSKWGKRIKFDSSLAEQYLAYNPRPVKESIKDMVESLIKQGYITVK